MPRQISFPNRQQKHERNMETDTDNSNLWRKTIKCPICGKEMNEGYLVTGIGEVMWIGRDVKLPQTRIRYRNAKRIPENTVLIQPSVPGRTQCETKAFRCPNCEMDIIFEKDK